MKRKTQFLITFFFLLIVKVAFTQVTFQKTFGGINGDDGRDVQQTDDGGYIITGFTWSFGSGIMNVYLIKINVNGDTTWTKTFGGGGLDKYFGNSVQQTDDGGYIIVGWTDAGWNTGTLWDIYLIKTNANGDSLWSKTYGGADAEYGLSVKQTNDGGYIIVGRTESFGSGLRDVYLIKTDTNGDTIWTKTFGGTNHDEGNSVQQTNDSGYIIVGLTTSFGDTLGDVYLIKTNANGDTLWTKAFGGIGFDEGHSVQQTNDGGYIIAGVTNSLGDTLGNVYLIKTDKNGTSLWSKIFSVASSDNYSRYQTVRQTSDGGYIITGNTYNFGAGSEDVYLIKTNGDGDSLWIRTFGASSSDFGSSVQQTIDGGFIIVGSTFSFGAGMVDVYLIKTDCMGNYLFWDSLNCPLTNLVLEPLLSLRQQILAVYPNPFSKQTTLQIGEIFKDATLTVYNSFGQQIKQINNISGQTVTFVRDNLTSGLYFIRLTEGSKVITTEKLLIID